MAKARGNIHADIDPEIIDGSDCPLHALRDPSQGRLEVSSDLGEPAGDGGSQLVPCSLQTLKGPVDRALNNPANRRLKAVQDGVGHLCRIPTLQKSTTIPQSPKTAHPGITAPLDFRVLIHISNWRRASASCRVSSVTT